MINKGSLKLRIMAYLTQSKDDMSASENWRKNKYKDHQEKMINRFKNACGFKR